MNKTFIFSCFLLLSTTLLGQNYIQVNQISYQQSNILIDNNFGLNNIANALTDFTNAWKDENRKTRAISRTEAQLNIVKNQYKDKVDFPKIIDGWHLVKITDNFNYCSDAKVYVNDGKISEIVINNYYGFSVDFNVMTPIKDAKAVINWQLPNRGTDTAEVYFAYDLNGPNLTDEPQKPGFITFWSDHRKAKTIEVWINRIKVGQLSKEIENAECFADGGLTLQFKPGVYEFKAAAHGSMDWRGTFEIKEDQCYTYLMNRDNTN
ncbi:hypothetical protein [Mesonia mobilis]|uniref:PA14 domain-containing protein n=1 Tax=Mesonia mobilis TaxID=369791 RepID=A0ABQ3C230_9FLAO|nr:hypothetical protein [Mesonia mobilis]MBQ0739674.1 hypothetical protein [Aquimarina celericrescens]GGZ65170.1 hypothetical protein GCM10008088_28160 [Mesonia mobilis]